MRKKKKENKSSFTDNEQNITVNYDLKNYTKGAFIGALVGGVGGLLYGRKIFLGILIGGLAGGYVSYQINKQEKRKPFTIK